MQSPAAIRSKQITRVGSLIAIKAGRWKELFIAVRHYVRETQLRHGPPVRAILMIAALRWLQFPGPSWRRCCQMPRCRAMADDMSFAARSSLSMTDEWRKTYRVVRRRLRRRSVATSVFASRRARPSALPKRRQPSSIRWREAHGSQTEAAPDEWFSLHPRGFLSQAPASAIALAEIVAMATR
jgi:hypothetical protein